jgi:hypothetical protein
VFGNGVLKDGDVIDEGFLDLEQVGVVVPGQANDLNQSINPLLGDEYSTLGETPNNTTLTVTYRVGGGINSNVPAGDISTTPSTSPVLGTATLTSVTNEKPAHGGKDEEDTIEIKEKAKAFFTTQNRCVTKEDYEARVLNIPAKFGNIAKAYVTREATEFEGTSNLSQVANKLGSAQSNFDSLQTFINEQIDNSTIANTKTFLQTKIDDFNSLPNPDLTNLARELELGTINIYLLGYNNRKQLIGNPNTDTTLTNDNLSNTLLSNISKYLENFKLLTDVITLNDGYVVNFGVIFDVIAEKYADKQQVKLNCIQKIKDYFKIEKMQFNQPIYKSNLEYELMGVEGVRSIGHVTITQKDDYNSTVADANLENATYTYSKEGDEYIDQSSGEGTTGYGYKYNFEGALSDDGTIILPPTLDTPAVFELKNPNTNIQGRVR